MRYKTTRPIDTLSVNEERYHGRALICLKAPEFVLSCSFHPCQLRLLLPRVPLARLFLAGW